MHSTPVKNESPNLPQGKVEVVEQTRRLQDEAVDLLRQRLTALCLVTSIVLTFAFTKGLFATGIPFFTLRENILVVTLGSFFVLRSSWPLSMLQLRVIESVVVGLGAVQLVVMFSEYLLDFAAAGDVASTTSVSSQITLWWTLSILFYGFVVPNSWQRAACILLPAGLIPVSQHLVLSAYHQDVADILEANHFHLHLHLVPILSATAAIYVANVSQSARLETFKARQFGQYRLKEKLKTGGMGEIYTAEHQLLKRPCAIKLIRREYETNAMAIARFEREVQTTARLTHWNTIEIFDYGHTSDGTFYYVMELLEGMTLAELVRTHGPLPPSRTVHFLRQTCAALREAHSIGFIHRDLKPSNIFAALLGGVYDVAKLLDFGLVKLATEDDRKDNTLTQEGKFGGSPLYMAPEQAAAFKSVNAQSDIYALGAVAYFLLTGQPPFQRDDMMAIIYAHAKDPVVPPSQLDGGIPDDLEAVILRCLEKKPEDRFPDAASMQRALLTCLCANDWTEADAASWWGQRKGRSRADERKDQ